MSGKQKIKLTAAAALTLVNAILIHKGETFCEENRELYRTPFDVENYENQYNRHTL